MSQQQATLAQLSQMVCYAYGAYTDTCDNGTDPTQAILNLAPSLMNVVPIFVYEHPNDVAVPPIPTAKGSHISGVAETSDWDSANNTIQGLSCGPAPSQTSTGYQLFGFTATVPASNTVPEMNVLALRGTVTTYEASVSLIGWSTDWLPTPAVLPTSGKKTMGTVDRGNVTDQQQRFFGKLLTSRHELSLYTRFSLHFGSFRIRL